MSADQLFIHQGRDECPALDLTGMVRTPDRSGSIEAAMGRVRNITDLKRDRDVVLHLLADAGENGLTDYCLTHLMSTPGNPRKQTSIGKRRGELCKDGLVAERLVIDPKTLKLVQDLRVPIAGSQSRCGVWVCIGFQRTDAAGCGYLTGPKEDA